MKSFSQTQEPDSSSLARGPDAARELSFLQLFRIYHQVLTPDESRALRLVELDRESYDSASREMGCEREQLKQLLFDARRKMFYGMRRSLEDLGHATV